MNDAIQRELFDSDKGLRTPPVLIGLTLITAITVAVAIWMVFFYAPIEKQMGFVQKIFYFHVPSAWNMLASAPILGVGAVGYLITRKDGWDRLADAAVELAILFGVLTLISGPLWGRKAWGVFWVWDARLTSSLVMLLTLIACKIVRGYAGPSAKQISAGLSVMAVLNALFVWVSVDLWRGTHPPKLVQTLTGEMLQTFLVSGIAMSLVYSVLLWMRLRTGRLVSAVDRLHMKMVEAGLDD